MIFINSNLWLSLSFRLVTSDDYRNYNQYYTANLDKINKTRFKKFLFYYI